MIAEPIPPFVPVTTLADRIKTWPMLAVHRFEEIEAVLLAFEARLIALEPKKVEAKPSYAQSGQFAGKSIFAPAKPVAPSPLPAGVPGSSPPTIFAPATPPKP